MQWLFVYIEAFPSFPLAARKLQIADKFRIGYLFHLTLWWKILTEKNMAVARTEVASPFLHKLGISELRDKYLAGSETGQ